jgi:hypothetical protein
MKEKITLKDYSHCRHKYWYYITDEDNPLESDKYCATCKKFLKHLYHIEPCE